MYSGNEATTYTITRTLGTSLLTIAVVNIARVLQEGYEGATYITRASEDCTIDEPDFIAGYQGEADV